MSDQEPKIEIPPPPLAPETTHIPICDFPIGAVTQRIKKCRDNCAVPPHAIVRVTATICRICLACPECGLEGPDVNVDENPPSAMDYRSAFRHGLPIRHYWLE